MARTQRKYDWPHHIAQQKKSGLSVKGPVTTYKFRVGITNHSSDDLR